MSERRGIVARSDQILGGTLALIALSLVQPAMFVQLLMLTETPGASVGNWPAVVARGVVAVLFLAGAVFLLVRRTRAGLLTSALAVVASLGMIVWIWSGSGVVFTLDIVLWLIIDGLVAVTALRLIRENEDEIRTAWRSHLHR